MFKTKIKPVLQPKPLLDRLRELPQIYSKDLPASIRIPAVPGQCNDEVLRPLLDASLDDVAFGIQALEQESSALFRRIQALRDLYTQARKRGALGSTSVAQAFADISKKERA